MTERRERSPTPAARVSGSARPAGALGSAIRRAAGVAARLGLTLTAVLTLIVLHAPAPSAFASGSAHAERARATWQGAARVLHALRSAASDDEVASDEVASDDEVLPVDADKLAHFGLFFALGFFWIGARKLERRGPRGALARVGVLAGLAALGELLQPLEGRIAELGDWAANAGGAVSGAALVWALVLVVRLTRGRRSSSKSRASARTATPAAHNGTTR